MKQAEGQASCLRGRVQDSKPQENIFRMIAFCHVHTGCKGMAVHLVSGEEPGETDFPTVNGQDQEG